jgi:pilus assembly protein Flp/PilA
MNHLLLNVYAKVKSFVLREEGQDLVEYALVVALIAVGATAGMQSLANNINTVFTNIGTSVTSLTA